MGLHWEGFIIFLGTDDLEATDSFYQDILGLELYKDQGLCKIYNIPGGGRVGFCSHMSVTRDEGKKSPIITLLTPNVDEVYQKMVQNGVTILSQPEENEFFKIYHFFLNDPNGYTVEIQRFLVA